jgi:hypothetical protein
MSKLRYQASIERPEHEVTVKHGKCGESEQSIKANFKHKDVSHCII